MKPRLEGAVPRPSALVLALALTFTACGSSGGGPAAEPSPPAGTAPSTSCRARAELTGKVSDQGTAQVAGPATQLEADNFFFAPTCMVVAPGTLTVTVKNDGTALHNLSITSLGIDKDVPAGQSITVTVAFSGSGPLPFFCKYHLASGMQGAFVPR